ncbi:MAG: orotidine-5'-phosphate decarboxylase [Alphaproteobacteria bacterium]|nr:orotidine-5'-phosphate decarboxylase [Alphaproteobacteria bacterium]MBU1516660.1 orotidine-5'-phosphate decarboxylase [Alphaproteobacteria bacterium]MBU2094416.1 orotidine-5'-phosphate decarboxylase [Alphaproteobacteria bacterium]MBU2152643.1 orotidine-5'-phosphate decarboxylase [Alphaproteobacteria bacterium]MBU2307588.1 orotidine-5'-phosphate decarboxylase [Alphaproteobacteria bacterium]
MPDFAERFLALAAARSPLCLGLDPSVELLRAWGLPDTAEGVRRFCGTVLEAAGERIAVVKPQSGFFERLGPAGMAELAWAVGQVRAQGALSLVDAKRGDVAGTMAGYAAGFAGPDSGFGGDAVTVSAYLGFDALRPVLDRAAAAGAAVFVVVHSSNLDGRALQSARHPDGRTVSEALADQITAYNSARGAGVGPVGAVVGATLRPTDATILDRLPASLILAPGVGPQGASLADVGVRFRRALSRTLPSVSRAVLQYGPDPAALRDALDRYRDTAWAAVTAGG